ncbi:hypothetical protein BX616_002510 [Lobosporangium transversale]|uniref:IPT/TIG domain-containing protein n=1 Tax=Lobosporangium transversale TaxID=64571 RepID=A0A1Y2GRI0_9FUNG|nr:hypothetical protein BCR41DRAFT_352578 [Lobosporangium transversale]KAF9916897.1 hypothetical protein BX616_002510 [Lobosporangium transversale]ORZ17484.1 hypothetical protein BCR41DRAFT_352578 [Lobosporangium transversale]|eukprot:XP_021881871.1 hypothetical protein BCR41DRAFT_352578 [Lobosporangium transversale]
MQLAFHMSDSQDTNSLVHNTMHLTLDTPGDPSLDSQHKQNAPGNPQLMHHHTNTALDNHDQQLSTTAQHPRDAWADQGHFPLLLGEISQRLIPARGGSHIILTGVNFREGIEVVFECPQLGDSVKSKVITPRIHKNTEMEFTSPNLLDWLAMNKGIHPCKELNLSVSLICAGAKGEEDMDTTFEMTAVEDSETELLHNIIELHRQLILTNLTSTLDLEANKTSRQKTLTLLKLEQPPNVTRSEHLALGVLYMLCNEHDQISTESLDIIRRATKEGHDMLHLAVIQGQRTLVREIVRHLLTWFRTHPITSDSELFARNKNGESALDLAKILRHEAIDHVLTEALEVAQELKNTTLKLPPRPLPIAPAADLSESTISSSSGSTYLSPVPSVPTQTLDRPLPPTPLTSPFQESETTYFPPLLANGVPTGSQERLASVDTSASAGSTSPSQPPQRVQTAHAIIENHSSIGPAPTIYEDSSTYISAAHYSHITAAPHYNHPSISYPDPTLHFQPHPAVSGEYSSSPIYPPNPHNIPPPRASTVPAPHTRPQGPQGERPAQPPYKTTSAAQFRPLPATPHSTAPPLPPPKHKITRVTRPKQFTVPAVGESPAESPPIPSMPQPLPVSIPYSSPLSHHQSAPLLPWPTPMPTPAQHTLPLPQHLMSPVDHQQHTYLHHHSQVTIPPSMPGQHQQYPTPQQYPMPQQYSASMPLPHHPGTVPSPLPAYQQPYSLSPDLHHPSPHIHKPNSQSSDDKVKVYVS